MKVVHFYMKPEVNDDDIWGMMKQNICVMDGAY